MRRHDVTKRHTLPNGHILQAILHLPPHTNTHTDRATRRAVKYAVPWLLLSFLISYVIECGPLSASLHASDYSAGHRWCGSAWLNVMDGEEMVMSETVTSPPRSEPLNNYRRIVWLSLNKCRDPLRTCNPTHLRPRLIHLNLDEKNSNGFFWELVTPEVWTSALSDHTFILSIYSFVCKEPLISNPGCCNLILQDHTLHWHTLILKGAI